MRHLRFIVFVVFLVAATAFALFNLRRTDREIEIAIERKTHQIKRQVEQTSRASVRPPPGLGETPNAEVPQVEKPRLPVYRTRPELTRLLFDQTARAAAVVRMLRDRPKAGAKLTPEVRRHTEEVRKQVLSLQQRFRESTQDVNRAAREAEPTFKNLLATLESTLGPDHPEVASSSQNLATLYYLQERYDEAEPLYKRALGIWERMPEPDQRSVADVLESYAMLLRKMARSEEAKQLELRSLSIRQMHAPLENPGNSELTPLGTPQPTRRPA